MTHKHRRERVTDEDRRALLKALGIAGAAGVAGEFTLSDIRNEVSTGGEELAAMGEAVRADLTDTVDTSLLASGMSGLGGAIETLPTLEAAGVPTEQGTAYESLTDEIWPVHEHLVDVGFFASAERHLPPFVPEHISAAARQVVGSGSLAEALSEVGFDADEGTALTSMIVSNDAHLGKWKPVGAYVQEGVEEFNPDDIAPLHQRASEGSLLWIDGLDHWLWQNRVLVTEEMLADGLWDIKAMLGGYYLLTRAAHDMAEGTISDELLTAMVTAGSAGAIIGQEKLTFDLIRVTDEMRAPIRGD